jgi:pyrroloquinoline quinone biosynthesis protein D
VNAAARPKIAPKARLRWDAKDQKHVLLSPERGLVLSASAARIVELCDGTRTIDAIVDALSAAHPAASRAEIARDVDELLATLRARALLETSP